ncbi:hypothetical protein KDD30_20480 (plasmid) [Photobacterium sp. GJ3]|nr:hypothetical protein KDD30_20480 [Photobacterium sp. GJ3]
MSEKYMLRALEISKSALPDCVPNPPVGCVFVKDNMVVSEGYTQAIGGNHAEVQALNAYDGQGESTYAQFLSKPWIPANITCSK